MLAASFRLQGEDIHTATFVLNIIMLKLPETTWMEAAKVDQGVPWHTGVLQGAKRFMASWHKKEEEASRQRALKRNKKPDNNKDTATTTGVGGVQQADETARKGRKREEADRVARNTVPK